jgi:cytochrome c oxidase subunit 1/cytochrome c oxidase subunit I+III
MSQRVLDVSDLPHGTADSRALLWWGNLGMMAIEGTMFAMVLATYLYLRVSNLDWPPATVAKPDLTLPLVNLVLLLLLMIPSLVIDRASLRDNEGAVKIALVVCIAGGVAFLIIRAIDMAALGFKWSDHAYGSIVWTIFFLHTLHMFAATGETTLLLVYSEMRPVMKKTLLDFRCLAVYWYFVILWWVPFFFLVYVEPWMRRKGA